MQLRDFATTVLAAPLASDSVVLHVADPSRFPLLGAGDYFYLVLQSFSDMGSVEVVKVVSQNGALFTVERSQNPLSFSTGDYAELRLTTNALTEFVAQRFYAEVGDIVVTDPRFGVRGDGVPETSSFLAAVSEANATGKRLVAPPGLVIKLTGNAIINIKVSVDFNGSVLDVSEFSGLVNFVRSTPEISYLPGSSVVDSLSAEATLDGTYIAGWLNEPLVEDSFVIIETSVPFYTYRGSVQNRIEFAKVTRFGMIEAPFLYPLASASVTKVTVFKMPPAWVHLDNIVFKVASNDMAGTIVQVSHNLVCMSGWRFVHDNFVNVNRNQTFFTLRKSCVVRAEGIYFPWPLRSLATTGYTYNFSQEYCYDTYFADMRGLGSGWGATGSNSCRRVTFERCALSRVDFHNPFHEFLRLRDCDIGSWGVLVTALGDLTIEGGSLTIDDGPYNNNHGFVRSREDTGGFCDGVLTLRGVTLVDKTSLLRSAVVHQWSSGNPKPEGSPIDYCFWRAVVFERVVAKSAKPISLFPAIRRNSGMRMPHSVSVAGCVDGLFRIEETSLHETVPYSPMSAPASLNSVQSAANLVVDVSDSRLTLLSLRDGAAQQYNIGMTLSNVRGPSTRSVEPSLELVFGGVVSVFGGAVEGFDFYSSAAVDKYLSVSCFGTRVRFTGAWNTHVVNSLNSYVDLAFVNCFINVPFPGHLTPLLAARHEGTRFSLGGGAPVDALNVTSSEFSGDTPQPLPALLNAGNKYHLLLGYDGDSTAKTISVELPFNGRTHHYYVSPTQSVSLTRSSDGLSISAVGVGGAVPRRLYIS